MTGPGWLPAGFAALMLAIAGCCAARLVIWWVRGRTTELEADALHVLMGVAMAGMLEPRLSPVPATGWRAVFAAAAAWFAWQAIRARSRSRSRNWRCMHPAPHAVECVAMVYMLLPTHAAGYRPAMEMPGMSGTAATANPALALVLALFMLGYILWTSDQLATLSRAGAVVAASVGPPSPGVSAPAPLGPAARVVSKVGAQRADSPAIAALAPRFAAGYKIAMSVAMGYMLITMI